MCQLAGSVRRQISSLSDIQAIRLYLWVPDGYQKKSLETELLSRGIGLRKEGPPDPGPPNILTHSPAPYRTFFVVPDLAVIDPLIPIAGVLDLVFTDDGMHGVGYGGVYKDSLSVPYRFSNSAIREIVEKAPKDREEHCGLSPTERSLLKNIDWTMGDDSEEPGGITRPFAGKIELSPERMLFSKPSGELLSAYYSATDSDLSPHLDRIRAYFSGEDVFVREDYEAWGQHSTAIPAPFLIGCLPHTEWYDPEDEVFVSLARDEAYLRRFLALLQSTEVWGSAKILDAIRRLPAPFVEKVKQVIDQELVLEKEKGVNTWFAGCSVVSAAVFGLLLTTMDFEGFASFGVVVAGGSALLFGVGWVWNLRKTYRYRRFVDE